MIILRVIKYDVEVAGFFMYANNLFVKVRTENLVNTNIYYSQMCVSARKKDRLL